MFREDFSYQGGLAPRTEARKANQNNPARHSTLPEHQFPKILVYGQKQSVVVLGELEELVVRRSRSHLGQIPNLVSAVAQCLNDWPVNVLIRNRGSRGRVFNRIDAVAPQDFRRVPKSHADPFLGEPRVGFQKIFDAFTGAELLQNVLDRDPSPGHDGFPHRDLRIRHDAVSPHVSLSRLPGSRATTQSTSRHEGVTSPACCVEHLADALMWGIDGREFTAPTFELGMAPAGSMYSTVIDLSRFMIALLAGSEGRAGRLLQRDTLEQMWTPHSLLYPLELLAFERDENGNGTAVPLRPF